ncbi:MAG: hypothetical protein Q4Q00_02030 [Turicibacter sp.]|nr:hypothetical protein [Turicibacter sp.]
MRSMFPPLVGSSRQTIVQLKVFYYVKNLAGLIYLDQYDSYANRAKEIIDRYNNGKLELIEVYALQKVLIDSVTFTNSVDELLFDINEAMIQYHEELMNWLEVLRTSDHDKINTTILSLQGQQENLFSELIKLFNQVNIPYQISDDRIIYERVNY